MDRVLRCPIFVTRSIPLVLLVSALGLGCLGSPDLEEGPAEASGYDDPWVPKSGPMTTQVVDFAIDPDGESPRYTVLVCGSLFVRALQDESLSWERIQIVATAGSFRRRSWRGRSPYIDLDDSDEGSCREFELTMINHGEAPAFGQLIIETPPSDATTVEFVHNTPDCIDCDQPAAGLREAVLRVIENAEDTLDIAIYGIDDPAVASAICAAATAGVQVRILTDEASEEPGSRSYYETLFGLDGLASCGAQVEAVRSYGLMHHKFIVADAHGDNPIVLTGSTNLTSAGLDENHNHAVILRDAGEVALEFEAEMDQLARHCASRRLDERVCTECTPVCVEDRSEEGPFELGDTDAEVYFSLSDDPLDVLRGRAASRKVDTPDPACDDEDAHCYCRPSGSRYKCSYCALGPDGYGLIGATHERLLISMYSGTDECFALAVRDAAERGVEAVAIWDYVRAGSAHSRDDYICDAGVETYIAQWGERVQVRNHNKLIVADDVVYTGSLNLGANAIRINNENTIVLRGSRLANEFANYIESERHTLRRLGVAPATCP